LEFIKVWKPVSWTAEEIDLVTRFKMTGITNFGR
jgi:hypothetical protein